MPVLESSSPNQREKHVLFLLAALALIVRAVAEFESPESRGSCLAVLNNPPQFCAEILWL
jgi:hypothetical protein